MTRERLLDDNFILRCRQTTNRSRSKAALGCQLWLCLRDFLTDFLPIQPTDRLTVPLERCSSVRHSFAERHMPE